MFKLLTSTKLRDRIAAPGSSGSRRWTLGLVLAALALTAAACSSGTNGASSTTTTVAPGGSTPTTAPAGSTPTTAVSSPGSSSATLTVSSGTATSVGSVLTGPNGHTLYHLTTEKNGSIDCTGSCSQVWPPLTVSSGQTPKLGSGLGGTIGTVKRPEGTTQVTYNGEPLYYYAPDTSAGVAMGQGVGGVWFAVAPDSSSSGSGSGSGSGGSGSTSTTSAPTTSTTTGCYSY
jgi:predicted lipoprotein with Yx(FWY)xxD motif